MIGSEAKPQPLPLQSAAEAPRFLPAAQRERLLMAELYRDEDLYPLGAPTRG